MSTPDLLLQWSIAAITALVLLARRRLTLFHAPTLFLAFHVVAFCLRPTLLHVTGNNGAWATFGLPWKFEQIRLMLWVSSAALAAFSLGYLLATRRAAPLRPAMPREWDTHDRRALGIVAALSLIAGGIAAYTAHGTSRPAAVLLDAQSVLLAPAALAVLAAGWRWWSLIPLGVWIWMRRTPEVPGDTLAWTAAVVLVPAVLRLWQSGRRRPPAILLSAVLIAAVGMVTLDFEALAIRWTSTGEAPLAASGKPVWERRLERPEAAFSESLAAVIALVPDRTDGYSYGAQHLAWVAAALPQADEVSPRVPTTRVRLQRHATVANQPMPLAAEGWMSGGWIGLGLTCAGAGVVFGIVFSWFSRRQDDPAAAVFLAITQGGVIPWIAFGGESGVRILFAAGLPLLAWSYLSARFRRGAETKTERDRLRDERGRRRLLGDAILHPHSAELPPEVRQEERRGDGRAWTPAPGTPPAADFSAAPGWAASQDQENGNDGAPPTRSAPSPAPPWRDTTRS